MQPDQPQYDSPTDDAYAQNHRTLLAILNQGQDGSAGQDAGAGSAGQGQLTIRLERVIASTDPAGLVPFDGERGIEALLAELAQGLDGCVRERSDGHLVGLFGTLALDGGAALPVEVTLGAGGQVRFACGPSPSVVVLLAALEALDRKLHVAARALGCDYLLLGEGYNPLASSPLDVPLVPRTRWTLLNAHLGQTGRYARDMMRCACSTQLILGYADERDTLQAFRLATALSPVLMFLTDNVRSFRGSGARRCPRMVRSVMWEETDPARCGVVPATFARDFSYERYLEWLEGVPAILLEDAAGTTVSTGKRTVCEVMHERVLDASEAEGLLTTVLPYARLRGPLELLQADALRPRMAAGYAAFAKGLLCNALSVGSAWSLVSDVRDGDVELAAHELRMHGWDATVYGRPVGTLVDDLLQISRSALDDAQERRILDEIAEQWEVRMVPRDAFVSQETKAARGW